MRKLTRIGFGVLCLFTLFAVSFTSQAQDTSQVLDTNPPVILSAVASGDGQTIVVTYSEPVEPIIAADNFNYEVQDGQSNRFIIIFAFMADPRTLLLQVTPPLSPQSSNTLYVVFSIPDLAGNELQPGAGVPIKFDITPPIVTCSVVLSMLFPPNKALVNVGLTAATDSSGSPVQVQVYSDEPAPPSVADATYQNGVLELSAPRSRSRRSRLLDCRYLDRRIWQCRWLLHDSDRSQERQRRSFEFCPDPGRRGAKSMFAVRVAIDTPFNPAVTTDATLQGGARDVGVRAGEFPVREDSRWGERPTGQNRNQPPNPELNPEPGAIRLPAHV